MPEPLGFRPHDVRLFPHFPRVQSTPPQLISIIVRVIPAGWQGLHYCRGKHAALFTLARTPQAGTAAELGVFDLFEGYGWLVHGADSCSCLNC